MMPILAVKVQAPTVCCFREWRSIRIYPKINYLFLYFFVFKLSSTGTLAFLLKCQRDREKQQDRPYPFISLVGHDKSFTIEDVSYTMEHSIEGANKIGGTIVPGGITHFADFSNSLGRILPLVSFWMAHGIALSRK